MFTVSFVVFKLVVYRFVKGEYCLLTTTEQYVCIQILWLLNKTTVYTNHWTFDVERFYNSRFFIIRKTEFSSENIMKTMCLR